MYSYCLSAPLLWNPAPSRFHVLVLTKLRRRVLAVRSRAISFSFKFLSKSIDFERRAGSGAAGDRKNIDFSLKTFRKVSILYPGSLGTVLGAQGRKNNRRKHWICAKLTKTAGHQMASTIKNLRRKPLILRGKSHRSIGDFMGVNSPILRPILEGPPAQNLYC